MAQCETPLGRPAGPYAAEHRRLRGRDNERSGFAALAGILVCISALCRRQRTAQLACYGAARVGRVAIHFLPVFRPGIHQLVRDRDELAVWTGVTLVILGVLIRAALMALAEPERSGPKRSSE